MQYEVFRQEEDLILTKAVKYIYTYSLSHNIIL